MTDSKNKPKNKGGRPTTYTQEVIDKATEYLTHYDMQGDVVPTVAGLAQYIGRSRETLHTWAKDENKPEFSDIYKEIMEIQEQKLVNGGLMSDYNPQITKMMLTKHGYSDKQEIDMNANVQADIKQISTEMTPEQAAQAYADLIKND